MKVRYFAILFFAVIFIVACSNSKGKKFTPADNNNSKINIENKEEISVKRIRSIYIDTALIFGNGIKLSILAPKPTGKITELMSDIISKRMLAIVTDNGIGGIGGDPAMVFACGIVNIDKKLSGSIPQKTEVKCDIQCYVANIASRTVFAVFSEQIVGVGNNEDKALINAMMQFKNSYKMQQMLQTASQKIVAYYNDNTTSIQSEVEALIAKDDYESAYALLRGVPQQCTALFKFSQNKLPIIADKILVRDASVNLTCMKSAIAANDTTYADVVGDIMAMIPLNTPQYAEAKSIFDKYLSDLNIKAEERAKIVAQKADADHRRKMEMLTLDAKLAHNAAVDARWDTALSFVDKGIDCVRDVGVTYGRNSSWTSFLNPSNLVSSVADMFDN